MFKLNLANILSAFTKVEEQLNNFLNQNAAELEKNQQAQLKLVDESKALSDDSEKAQRVLARVKALTE